MGVCELAIDNFNLSDECCILDVRDNASYRAGHIMGAVHCPLNVSDDELLRTIGTAEQVFVLCGGGTKAGRMAERLSMLTPTLDIIHLIGGTRRAVALGWQLVAE